MMTRKNIMYGFLMASLGMGTAFSAAAVVDGVGTGSTGVTVEVAGATVEGGVSETETLTTHSPNAPATNLNGDGLQGGSSVAGGALGQSNETEGGNVINGSTNGNDAQNVKGEHADDDEKHEEVNSDEEDEVENESKEEVQSGSSQPTASQDDQKKIEKDDKKDVPVNEEKGQNVYTQVELSLQDQNISNEAEDLEKEIDAFLKKGNAEKTQDEAKVLKGKVDAFGINKGDSFTSSPDLKAKVDKLVAFIDPKGSNASYSTKAKVGTSFGAALVCFAGFKLFQEYQNVAKMALTDEHLQEENLFFVACTNVLGSIKNAIVGIFASSEEADDLAQ